MRGVILGTAAYMSPEQARGKPIDERADIWAFGCVLYQMLTGRALFGGETVSDTIAAILSREPVLDQLPANTPPSVRRLLRRCLAREPRGRLRHIADARLELQDMDVGDAALPQAVAPVGLRWMPLAAVAVAAAVAGAIAVYLTQRAATPGSHGAHSSVRPHHRRQRRRQRRARLTRRTVSGGGRAVRCEHAPLPRRIAEPGNRRRRALLVPGQPQPRAAAGEQRVAQDGRLWRPGSRIRQRPARRVGLFVASEWSALVR